MMKVFFRIGIVFLLFNSAAVAQEVISVRAGEHSSYSRLVMQPPTQLWELQQSGREASLVLSNWSGEFDYSSVFDRIPRTRLLGLTQEAGENQTTLALSLACDCQISVDILGALLVLDIRDAVAPVRQPKEVRGLSLQPEEQSVGADPAPEQIPNDAGASSVQNDYDLPANQNTPVVEPPEDEALAAWLAERLETAAARGFVELNEVDLIDDAEDTTVSAKPSGALAIDSTSSIETANSRQSVQPETVLQPKFESIDELESLTGQLRSSLDAVLDDGSRQSLRVLVPETMKVNRSGLDSPQVRNSREEVTDTNNCIPEHFLFAPSWVGNGGLSKQIIALRSNYVREFDKPNPETAKKLALLYIASGMGLEAIAIISEMEEPFEKSDLYVEIAEIVEGLPVRGDGVLQAAAGCSGRTALWRTIAVNDAESQPILNDDALVDDFSELPLVLRRVVGPRLVQSLLVRAQVETARRIFSIVDRAAGVHGPAHELLRAQFLEIEGRFDEAKKSYAKLIVGNSFVATDAMVNLVSGMLDRGEKIDPDLLEQLETEAFRNRNLDVGQELRVLEIKARAETASLESALRVVAEMIDEQPERRTHFMKAAAAILANENFEEEQIQDFVSAIYTHWSVVTAPEIQDEARENITDHLYNSGLPNGALVYINSVGIPETNGARNLVNRSLFASGKSREAFENAVEMGLSENAEQNRNAALALSRLERHGEAFDLVRAASLPEPELAEFGWRAGRWEIAQKSENPTIAALAREMLVTSKSNSEEIAVDSSASNFLVATYPTIEKSNEALKKASSIRNLIETGLKEF